MKKTGEQSLLCLFVSFFPGFLLLLRKGELVLLLPVCFSPRPGCPQQEKTISIIYNIFFFYFINGINAC